MTGITYKGPLIMNVDLLNKLPSEMREFLSEANGFIAYGGGLHIRGICDSPDWHSLERVWTGDDALSSLFTAVLPSDIPFGQDCMGDQFLLRDGEVHRLWAECGELVNMKMDFKNFLEEAQENPDTLLGMNPLKQLAIEGKKLEPGQSIDAYPPFVFKESGRGVDLTPMPSLERLRFLSSLTKQLANAPDGTEVELKVINRNTAKDKKKPWWKF
jgi:hypothetical protein